MKKGEPVGSLYFAPHGLLFCRLVQVRLIEGSFEKSNTGREGLGKIRAFRFCERFMPQPIAAVGFWPLRQVESEFAAPHAL